MEFRYLVSFLAIAEELHFGRAAARLHLAQPSLSQQLQRLERELGVELVARTSHEVRLTEAGQAFRAEAQAIVDRATKAVEAAREAAAGRVGRLNIGFNFPAGRRILPPTLRRLQRDHPGVRTKLWEKRSGPQLAALDADELDVAMVFGRPSAQHLRHRQVMRIPLVAVVGENHPWAGREQVPFRELRRQPCLMFRREESPAMHDTIHAAAESCGIRLNVVEEVDDTGATEILVTTRPVAAFASAARRTYPWSRGLVTVSLVDPVPMLSVNVVWREQPKPVVSAFLETMEAAGIPGGEPGSTERGLARVS